MSKKLVTAVATTACLMLSTVACSASSSSTSSPGPSASGTPGSNSSATAPAAAAGGFDSNVLSTAPSNGNSADWVSWDKGSCSFVPATDHPATWSAATRKSTQTFLVGFGAQDTTNEVNITMNKSMTSFAQTAGVDLAFADYKFPSTSEPVSAARSIVVRNPSVVVSNNQVDALLSSVNNIYAKACMPVVQVVTASKGTVLFGPGNGAMGDLEGKRLVEFAKSKNWTANDTTLITTYYPTGGPEVALRASNCAAAVTAAFPGVASVSHDTASTTALELQNNFTDVLTAHPDAKHILVCTVADLWALADANALKLAGRQMDAAVTGVNGGSAVLDAIKAGNTALVGSVDLGADKWGQYWIPLAEDIASGKPVPAQVYAPIAMLPAQIPTR